MCSEEWQERGNTECVRRDVHFEEGRGTIMAVNEPSDGSATTGDSALTVIDGTNKLLLPGYPPPTSLPHAPCVVCRVPCVPCGACRVCRVCRAHA